MKKAIVFCLILSISSLLFAQQKFALVMGNSNYTSFGTLKNPVNDANDMADVLESLGFTVDKLLDGSKGQMIEAIENFKKRLSVSENSYGFLFYAGHAVQHNGVNYLIPATAEIRNQNYLGDSSVSIQAMLAELNEAGNELNIVVLDACRNFPAARNRDISIISTVGNQPADSIIVYATSAGSVASDGIGRNGTFTEHLLNNLKVPGLEIMEIFRRTGADVSKATNRNQIPAIYNQFFGTAYLSPRPEQGFTPTLAVSTQVTGISQQYAFLTSADVGDLIITSQIAGSIMIDGKIIAREINGQIVETRIKEGGTVTVSNIETGRTEVAVKADDGRIIKALNTIMVQKGQAIAVEIFVPVQQVALARTVVSDNLLNQGMEYYNQGDYNKAIECFLEALNIQEKTTGKEHPDYATLLSNLGVVYYNIGDYPRAETYFLQSLSIRERTVGKEHPDYAASLNNIGTLYDLMSVYTSAEIYYLEAIDIYGRLLGKDHPDYAASINNLGRLYYNIGDYARAEKCYLESLGITERVQGMDHPQYAGLLNNIGTLYRDMRDYARAEVYYLEAISIYERVLGKEHPLTASCIGNLAELYVNIGDFARAENYFLESFSIKEKMLGKDHPDYAGSLNNIGALYRDMGDYARAERYYLEALSIYERVLGKDHPSYATSLDNLGGLYYSIGNYTQAEPYYLLARDIRERALGKSHPDYVQSLNNISLLYLSTQQYQEALNYKTEADQLSKIFVNNYFSFMSGQQQDAYWSANAFLFELSNSLSYYYPVSESNVLNYDNVLFTKSLLLHSTNMLRDTIYNSEDQSLISQYEELSRLRQQISSLRQSNGNEDYIRELEQIAETREKSLTQVSAGLSDFNTILNFNWKDIRNSLKPNEAAVEFVSFRLYDKGWTDRTIYAALVLKPGTSDPLWVTLCEETELIDILAKTEGVLRPNDKVRILYDVHGVDLYNAIWKPLEEALDGTKTVFYSSSGLLHKISFIAIPVTGNKRLMDIYDLNLISSTREIIYRNKPVQKPNSAVVYGGLFYDVDEATMLQEALNNSSSTRDIIDTEEYLQSENYLQWRYLIWTDSESKSIYILLNESGIPAILYNGAIGNEESFKALSGKKTSVIHLATHGFFIETVPISHVKDYGQYQPCGTGNQRTTENPMMRSGLLLSGANSAWRGNPISGVEDGILFSDEIAQLNLLGTELVVLSVSNSALGSTNSTEGVFGLQRAFKLAGVQSLIMSMWDIDDEATSLLMTAFYQNWLSGMSKQEALRVAIRQLRSIPRFVSPFYWAAFVLLD